jgi:hypothetical protein
MVVGGEGLTLYQPDSWDLKPRHFFGPPLFRPRLNSIKLMQQHQIYST